MCGIAGVFTPKKNVAKTIGTIIEKEWNRGHTSFGIETYDVDGYLHVRKGRTAPSGLNEVRGDIGIGHQRYSTRGSNEPSFLENNAQPYAIHYIPLNGKFEMERCDEIPKRDIKVKSMMSIAHNGDIFSKGQVKDYLYQCDIKYLGRPFGEQLFKNYEPEGVLTEEKLFQTARKIIPETRGSFSYAGFVIDRNYNQFMFAGRDPWGIKPGFIGRIDDGFAVASEDAALQTIGCDRKDIFEMKKGCFYVVDDELNVDYIKVEAGDTHKCAFEFVYFADIGSTFGGMSIARARENLGRRLGTEQPANADLVVPIPDSGRSLAVGYAYETKIRYTDAGFSKNRKRDKRSFILQNSKKRENEVLRKMIPVDSIMCDKRVVLVDDSLVRGTTMRGIIDNVRKIGGATEVHVRIGSPPIISPCYLGIDMKSRGEFAAARAAEKLGYDLYGGFKDFGAVGFEADQVKKVTEEVRKEIGADSLGYISLESVIEELGEECCFGCWNPLLNPNDLLVDILTAIKEHPDGYRV